MSLSVSFITVFTTELLSSCSKNDTSYLNSDLFIFVQFLSLVLHAITVFQYILVNFMSFDFFSTLKSTDQEFRCFLFPIINRKTKIPPCSVTYEIESQGLKENSRLGGKGNMKISLVFPVPALLKLPFQVPQAQENFSLYVILCTLR